MEMIRKNMRLMFLFANVNFDWDRLLGKYGFTNRVIDGISLTITNLTLAIKAKNFKASILVCE